MSEHCKQNRTSRRETFGGAAIAGLLAAIGPLGTGVAFGQTSDASPGLCSPEVLNAPDVAIIEYDPFLPGATVRELIFDVSTGDQACDVDFAVLDRTESPSRLFRLGDLVLEISPSEEEGQLTPTERIGVYRLSIPANTELRLALDVVVLQGAVIEAGDHVLEPSFEFYEPDTIRPIGNRWQSIVMLRSLPRAQLNITGADGSFGSGSSVSTVDFGEAESGAERRIFLQVRANTLSRLSLASENGGELIHESNELAPPIQYSVILEGVPIDLREPVSQDRDPPRTLEGQSLPMDITLGDIAGAMAGRYEDVITIEFSPL